MKSLQNPTTGIFRGQRVQIFKIKVEPKEEKDPKENQTSLESDHNYAAPWESQFQPKLEPLVKLEEVEDNETIDPDLFHRIGSSVQACQPLLKPLPQLLSQPHFEPNEDPLSVTNVTNIKNEPDDEVEEVEPKIIDISTSITKENSRKACPICCKMVHSSSISRHIKAVHKSENKRKKVKEKGKKCRYCLKFFHPSSILRHIKDIHGIGSGHEETGVPCGSCNLTFPSIEELNVHWKVNHSLEELNANHQCKFCDKKFAKQKNMLLHVKNCDIKSVKRC